MWSMPRSVLKVVAVLIALCAVGGFVLGVRGAPEKARLPGEGPPGSVSAAQIQATEAKPLADEPLVPPVAPMVEEKPKVEEKKVPAPDRLDLAADQPPPQSVTVVAPAKNAAPKPPATPSAAEDRVGDLLDGITPPPVDPPI